MVVVGIVWHSSPPSLVNIVIRAKVGQKLDRILANSGRIRGFGYCFFFFFFFFFFFLGGGVYVGNFNL